MLRASAGCARTRASRPTPAAAVAAATIAARQQLVHAALQRVSLAAVVGQLLLQCVDAAVSLSQALAQLNLRPAAGGGREGDEGETGSAVQSAAFREATEQEEVLPEVGPFVCVAPKSVLGGHLLLSPARR